MSAPRASPYRRLRDGVRDVNRRAINPVTLRFAGRPLAPYGAVRHVGRRSGRVVHTPVLVGTMGDRFVVPLPYGTDADWYRDVRAADGCTIVRQGRAYRAAPPHLVAPAAAGAAFPGWMHEPIQRAGAWQYLRLQRGEEQPAAYREFTRAHPAGPAAAGVAGALLLGALAWRLLR